MEKVSSSRTGKPKGRVAKLMERGNLFAPDCPSREVMKHVTSSWGVLVLIALQDGTLRFSELRRKVAGVSERMLAQTLQWLETDGLVERRAFKVVPPHVEYELTPMGVEAAGHVAALADWIEENLGRMRAKA
jgi:DNA-binding HxlR family transcriptional regulator